MFGTNSLFLFINPICDEKSEGTPDVVDYDFAQEEIAKASGLLVEGGDADENERMSQILELFPMVAEANAIRCVICKHQQKSLCNNICNFTNNLIVIRSCFHSLCTYRLFPLQHLTIQNLLTIEVMKWRKK